MSSPRIQAALAVAVSSVLASVASAQVHIDFENLAPGTVVTNQYPEVAFSSSAGNSNFVLGTTTTSQFICTGASLSQIYCVEDTYLDFASPASNLTFLAIEANCACIDAQFRVFQNGVFTTTVNLVGLGGTGNVPVDLSQYPNITRLEIVNILRDTGLENGIGWDDFRFTASSGTAFCSGDGTAAACPCGNTGAAGRGCANSVNAAGAQLVANGAASIANDSVVLLGSGMPNSSALYLQGTSTVNSGSGIAFGDGLRCAGGSVTRLKVVSNSGGASQYPQAGDPSVSVRGGVLSPAVRSYQVWYRNVATYCTTSAFNLTNGWSIAWGI